MPGLGCERKVQVTASVLSSGGHTIAAPAGRMNEARPPELALRLRAASDEITRALL